jgi:Lrp/AsnC family transcriptional regulator, leucine-responsive regulatory protein
MDKIDYLIFSELLKDASLSYVEISNKLGISSYTVRRHYEKMKKEGAIQKCVVSIDLSKLGYQGKALLLITVTPNSNKSDTIAYLKKIRNIMVITEIIGPYDIIAIAPITDLKNIQTLVKEVREAPCLQRVEIACMDDTHFPIGPNFNNILSQKSCALATK